MGSVSGCSWQVAGSWISLDERLPTIDGRALVDGQKLRHNHPIDKVPVPLTGRSTDPYPLRLRDSEHAA